MIPENINQGRLQYFIWFAKLLSDKISAILQELLLQNIPSDFCIGDPVCFFRRYAESSSAFVYPSL